MIGGPEDENQPRLIDERWREGNASLAQDLDQARIPPPVVAAASCLLLLSFPRNTHMHKHARTTCTCTCARTYTPLHRSRRLAPLR